ncbi:hypothetical protein Y1Q_0012904 [Alligator mississippiensis]|uniref:Uncharacterized protein n=1 Tax=Alligator mississippiensis TaxID=8496 RepID=A0A151P1Q9_ALLMI|nr:hypothetical protein Y1Q_0012904 [Alligator mississippiensis]
MDLTISVETWNLTIGLYLIEFIKKPKKEAIISMIDGVGVEHRTNLERLGMVVVFYQELYNASPEDTEAMQEYLRKLTHIFGEDKSQTLVEEWTLEINNSPQLQEW